MKSNCRIAIIDDNETWRFVLAHFLEQRGFRVKTFGDPSRFLKAAHQFDVALVDFCIAPKRHQLDIDGAELICRVKEQYDVPPLLVLVSSFFTDDILEAAEATCPEADAYLSKSLGLEGLEKAVNKLISEHQRGGQPVASVAERQPAGLSREH